MTTSSLTILFFLFFKCSYIGENNCNDQLKNFPNHITSIANFFRANRIPALKLLPETQNPYFVLPYQCFGFIVPIVISYAIKRKKKIN